ncbi:hypothetical protein EXE43_06780 [Halorubrum sp. SS5]|nr:hypothetical protein EXE43_06780 [Halorubrum sp. SS5]
MTLRDTTWHTVLLTLTRQDEFKLTDLGFKDSEKHTVKRCLRELEEYGWIERDSPQHSIWRAGPRFKALARVADERLDVE